MPDSTGSFLEWETTDPVVQATEPPSATDAFIEVYNVGNNDPS